jgi:hypothetical protein
MKDKIKELIETIPKVYIKFIKNRPELLAWVMSNTKLPLDRSLPEHTRSALYEESDICRNGSKMKWVGANTGWGSCGRPTQCQCARESVSSAVKAAKAQRSQADIDAENLKREQTNLAKYGVTNTGQTAKARTNHEAFYSDSVRVTESVEKLEQTMLTKYGVKNAQQVDEFKKKTMSTNLERYGVENPKHRGIPKESLDVLADPILLKNLLTGNPTKRASELLSVSSSSINKYVRDHGILVEKYLTLGEIEISEFLTSHSIRHERNTRSIIPPKELDFYLPDYNLAIEFDGLYWHSDQFKDRLYHSIKTKDCGVKGIQLLHIFEDEWADSSEFIKRKILHLCDKTPKKVIGARKLTIIESSKDDLSIFINSNHIQGMPPGASHYLSVFHGDVIVAAVTLKKVDDEIIDMTRFCTDQQGTYPGLMSKIVSYIKKNYDYNSLITFADLRYSNGGVYIKSGFTEVGRLAADYFYVIRDKREHKFNLRKKSIEKRFGISPEGKTESQMAEEAGLRKIYDCGKIKYRIDLK